MGSFRSLELKQSFVTKHYAFEHSCNTALVVAALSYNLPDSEVSACFPCAARPPPLVTVKRFVAIFTPTNRNFSFVTPK